MNPFLDYMLKGRHYWVPFISLLIGLVFLLISLFYLDPIGEPKLYDFVSSLGTIFGVGAVFGAVVKSFQFTGVFEQAVSDVVYAERFVGLRNELDEIWLKVFRAIVGNKFGSFADEIHQTFVNEYFLDDTKKHYYSRIRRFMKVDWCPDSNQMLKVTGINEVVARPFIQGEIIHYKVIFRNSHKDGLNFDPTKWKIGDVPLEEKNEDGSIKKNIKYDIVESQTPDERGYYRTQVTIPLQGKDEYVIHREIESDLDMSLRPYIRFPNNNYVGRMEVEVDCQAKGLVVHMESLGTTQSFKPTKGSRDPKRKFLQEEYEGVMLPQQGFIIIFTRE